MERCRREIAAVEAELLAGNPDVAGLVLALSDWWAELRILEGQANPPNGAGTLHEAQDLQALGATGVNGCPAS